MTTLHETQSAHETARFDAALSRVHGLEPEDLNGFTNHAPMAIEALVELGHGDFIDRYLERDLGRFAKALPGIPIEPAAYETALGDFDRRGDWLATWRAHLADAPRWGDVLTDALPMLAPVLFGGAAHGLIRAAHAVRSLEREDTPARRDELASALAYWCARAQRLPGVPGAKPGGESFGACLAHIEPVPPADRKWGLFTDAVAALEDRRSFVDAIESLTIPKNVAGSDIGEICVAMRALYLESPALRIAYIHTITAPSALRLLAPYADSETLRSLYGYGAQAVAALHAVSHLPGNGEPDAEIEVLAADPILVARRAAETLEEHVIKFTEVALREHAIAPDSTWLWAAADAVRAHERRPA